MTPEQEQDVRRALAALARRDADPTLPPEVAQRLDHVLGDLVAARAEGPEQRTGSGTADRRPRRWAHQLVAAAAVAVIALAGAAVATHGFRGSAGEDSAGTAPSARSAAAGASSATPSGRAGSAAGGAAARALAPPPRLHRDTLRADVTRLVEHPTALAPGSSGSARLRPQQAESRPAATCRQPPLRPGERALGVLLDGRAATLVLGARTDGVRRALVYSCTDPGTVVARTSVTAR